MSSEIQFGDLQQTQPKSALRPDQDAHFLVATVGEIGPHELPIYVDLDAIRDMEAHARTNTDVELGGVMLGQQSVDSEGRPFVWISDCLRARHYEATKGSFKFTHDTWSQITSERKQYRPDLEMVGWYHTHPGWSVFLSGMDLFICNHFFNRPLDVALVIDPVADDRGWFQWTESEKSVTEKTGGFYLSTNRFRHQELDFFSRRYNRQPLAIPDPRYTSPAAGNSITVPGLNWRDDKGQNQHPNPGLFYGNAGEQTMGLMNGKHAYYELAFLIMFPLTILALAIIAWKLLSLPAAAIAPASAQTAAVGDIPQEAATKIQSLLAREQVWQEALGRLAESQTGDGDLAEAYVNLTSENSQLKSNLIAQQALSEKLSRQRDEAQKLADLAQQEWKSKSELAEKLESQLVSARSQLNQTKSMTAKSNQNKASTSTATEPTPSDTPWWWLATGGGVCSIIGGVIGFLSRGNSEAAHKLDDRLEDSELNRNDGGLA